MADQRPPLDAFYVFDDGATVVVLPDGRRYDGAAVKDLGRRMVDVTTSGGLVLRESRRLFGLRRDQIPEVPNGTQITTSRGTFYVEARELVDDEVVHVYAAPERY